MKNFNSKQLTGQKGGAAVEFVMIVPLLLLLIFGIIEFGLIMYNKHIITNASLALEKSLCRVVK